MKIYTVRDRMIDYFVLPAFFADNDMQAMSMIAASVNGDRKDALAQTPHHFELWRLGEIKEQTGTLSESKEFLAECSGFIRSRVRESPNGRAAQDSAADRAAERDLKHARDDASAANGTGADGEKGPAEKGPENARQLDRAW